MIYIINEPPQACQRKFGKGRIYDPHKALKERWRWILKAQHKGPLLCGKPLELIATFYLPIPESLSEKKKASLEGTRQSRRPDFDNYVKLLCDTSMTVIIGDDGIISDAHIFKRYSHNPRTEFEFRELKCGSW